MSIDDDVLPADISHVFTATGDQTTNEEGVSVHVSTIAIHVELSMDDNVVPAQDLTNTLERPGDKEHLATKIISREQPINNTEDASIVSFSSELSQDAPIDEDTPDTLNETFI